MVGQLTGRNTEPLWTPPPDMMPAVVTAWKKFYARAASGKDGYVITPYDYRLLYIAQKGRCWICQKAKGVHPDDPRGTGTRRLGVDHNHTTGAVRGLLCSGGDRTCNRVLGWFRDHPAPFQRAAQYLVNPPAEVLYRIRETRAALGNVGAEWSEEQIEKLAVDMLWNVRRQEGDRS